MVILVVVVMRALSLFSIKTGIMIKGQTVWYGMPH